MNIRLKHRGVPTMCHCIYKNKSWNKAIYYACLCNSVIMGVSRLSIGSNLRTGADEHGEQASLMACCFPWCEQEGTQL